jgi:hypothetical protein
VGTSLTDVKHWRDFCRAAAKDLSLLERDPDGILAATLSQNGQPWPEGLFATRRRYERITDKIESDFGERDWDRIYELGGGYGGQALSIFRRFGEDIEYELRDLIEPFNLQITFLQSHGYHAVFTSGELPDLYLSSFALSELRADAQIEELEWAREAERGFVYWNGWLAGELTLGAFLDHLNREDVQVERCPDNPHNRMILWGAS